MKCGYVLVDCTGFDFSNVTKIDGIYNKMMAAYKTGKFVLCENMVNGAAKFSPIPSFLAIANNKIVLTVMNLAYNIASDDTISTDSRSVDNSNNERENETKTRTIKK